LIEKITKVLSESEILPIAKQRTSSEQRLLFALNLALIEIDLKKENTLKDTN